MANPPDPAPFDQHADAYDDELNQALSVSGETKAYFAQERIKWLRVCLGRLREEPHSAIDYGCGIGDTSELLLGTLKVDSVLGLDVSRRSLELAAQRHGSGRSRFLGFSEHAPAADVDLVYCNGVFHHIAVGERAGCLDYILRCLHPGGLFALWENNPWNPGTRYVMARTPFDRDAVTLTPRECARLVQAAGFHLISVSYLFFFPRFLKWFRGLEPYFSSIPLGAQYQVLCRKP